MNSLRKITKAVTGKGKGKEGESSSTRPRKRQLVVSESEEDRPTQQEQEDEEMESDDQSTEKPEWRVGTSLDTLSSDWQFFLYKEKMGTAENIRKQLIGERKVVLNDFLGFGLIESFERLGWEQALIWNDNDNSEVYLEGIIEWMGTLKRNLGKKPPQTIKLTGTVNQKKVVMSFATLNKIAQFDNGPIPGKDFDYLPENILTGAVRGENWRAMIAHLFRFTEEELEDGDVKLERVRLKALPHLLTYILNVNVCPRTSDRTMIRLNEIVVLYALATGSLSLSLRQIIMLNIWDARNKKLKTILPHPRLITSLFRLHQAIPQGAAMVDLSQVPISMKRLTRGAEWDLKETSQARILRDVKINSFLIAPKEGFTREEVLARLNGGGGDGEADERRDAGRERVPVRRDTGLLGTGVGREIPRVRIEQPDSYVQWSPFEQSMWNLSVSQAETQQAYFEERRRFERGMAYAHELEIRRRFEYDEQVCHHNDYLANRRIIDNPSK